MAPSRATWVRAYIKRFVVPGKLRGGRRGGASRDSAEAKNIVTREATDSTCQAQGSCLYQHIPKPTLLSVLCVLVVCVLFYRHFYFPDQLAGAYNMYTLNDIVLSFTLHTTPSVFSTYPPKDMKKNQVSCYHRDRKLA